MSATTVKKRPSPSFVAQPLPPIYSKDSKVLILGTMPSPKSREKGFYYGHSQNRFWSVLARVFSCPVPAAKDERDRLILGNRLALFDVLRSCTISGASDHSITDPVANDIIPILENSSISYIATTGKKAYELYMKYTFGKTGIEPIALPSTSAQNFKFSFDDLAKEYSILKLLVGK